MEKGRSIILALGTNLGNRAANLQQSLIHLSDLVGKVVGISGLYENAAIGFEGPDFLNACVRLETQLEAVELLDVLKRIEDLMGRQPSNDGTYASRPIDIDIVYYGNQTITSERLAIPHKRMVERAFVLVPLVDLAPDWVHPVLGLNSCQLLEKCADHSEVRKTEFKLLPSRQALFQRMGLLTIEGNIGAGKTTLAKMIAKRFNAKLVLERFADNPFLPQFYENPARYAFPLEMSFLADRYQQFMEDTAQYELFNPFMVSDYDIHKSLIFSRITLQSDEYDLYKKLFGIMYREASTPDLYVYLHQDTEQLLENIKKRGRDYERNIQPDYLEKINNGYQSHLKELPKSRVLLVDVRDLDFVANKNDFSQVLDLLTNRLINNYINEFKVAD